MTDKPLGDSQLDAAIDRAVREMMEAEPRADLRERVLAELAGPPARATLWPRFAFGLVAATMAVVFAIQFVQRPPARPADQTLVAVPPRLQSPATTSTPTNAPAPRVSPSAPTRAPAKASGSPAPAARRTIVSDDRPIQAASIDTVDALAVEPMTSVERLSPIAPIVIAGLERAPAADLSITPITIERIEITPLTPPSPQR